MQYICKTTFAIYLHRYALSAGLSAFLVQLVKKDVICMRCLRLRHCFKYLFWKMFLKFMLFTILLFYMDVVRGLNDEVQVRLEN